jgi:hypothetical protein
MPNQEQPSVLVGFFDHNRRRIVGERHHELLGRVRSSILGRIDSGELEGRFPVDEVRCQWRLDFGAQQTPCFFFRAGNSWRRVAAR